MKIISVRKGFASDHSSTSYEFLAVDKPLSKSARTTVASLSSRAHPTARRVSFTYNAEGYDLAGGWHNLMLHHYDVMYCESYDWWILAMAFDAPEKLQQAAAEYDFDGDDGQGVDITIDGNRVIVGIHCRLDLGMAYAYDHDEGYNDEDEDDDDIDTNDYLLSLLTRIRGQLIQGDFRALYEVWKVYGWDDDEEDDLLTPPVPPEKDTGQEILQELREKLVSVW